MPISGLCIGLLLGSAAPEMVIITSCAGRLEALRRRDIESEAGDVIGGKVGREQAADVTQELEDRK